MMNIQFETQVYFVCKKCLLEIKEHDNGWYFHAMGKHLNTYEAFELWSTLNSGDLNTFKMYINSILKNPKAMKY